MPQIGRVLRRPAGRLLLRRWQHDGPIMQKDKGMVPYRIVPADQSRVGARQLSSRRSSVAGKTRSSDESVAQSDLDAVMEQVPKGALALGGIAVLLLLMGWCFVYFFIFIPRGSVG